MMQGWSYSFFVSGVPDQRVLIKILPVFRVLLVNFSDLALVP